MAEHMTAEQLREELRRIQAYAGDKLDTIDSMREAGDALLVIANSIGQLAARLSGMAAVPDGWVLLPRELTAGNGAKYGLIGEIRSSVDGGFVPWTDVKAVHAAVVRLFEGKAPAAPEVPGHG